MEPQVDVASSSSSAFSALSDIIEREAANVNSPKEDSVEQQVQLSEQDEKMTNLVLSLSRQNDSNTITAPTSSDFSEQHVEHVMKRARTEDDDDDPEYDSDYEYLPEADNNSNDYEGRKRSYPKLTSTLSDKNSTIKQFFESQKSVPVDAYYSYHDDNYPPGIKSNYAGPDEVIISRQFFTVLLSMASVSSMKPFLNHRHFRFTYYPRPDGLPFNQENNENVSYLTTNRSQSTSIPRKSLSRIDSSTPVSQSTPAVSPVVQSNLSSVPQLNPVLSSVPQSNLTLPPVAQSNPSLSPISQSNLTLPPVAQPHPTLPSSPLLQDDSQSPTSPHPPTEFESQLYDYSQPADKLSSSNQTLPSSVPKPFPLSKQSPYPFNQSPVSTQLRNQTSLLSSPPTQPEMQGPPISHSKLSLSPSKEDRELSDSSSSDRSPSPIHLSVMQQPVNPIDIQDPYSDDFLPFQIPTADSLSEASQLPKPAVIPFETVKESMTVHLLPFAPVVVKSKTVGLAFLSTVIPPKGFE